MDKIAIVWIGVCAAAILMVNRGDAVAEPWRMVDQPELKMQLEQATAAANRVAGRAGPRGERLGTLDGAQPGRQDLGRAPDLLQGILWADVALRRRLGHRPGEEAAFARPSPVLPLRPSAGVRRQVLHRRAVERHREHGPVRVRPGQQHAGGAGRDRRGPRRRGSPAGGRARWTDLRHGNPGQSGRPVYLRSETRQGGQGLRPRGTQPSQRRLEPLCHGRGRYARVYRQRNDPGLVPRGGRIFRRAKRRCCSSRRPSS